MSQPRDRRRVALQALYQLDSGCGRPVLVLVFEVLGLCGRIDALYIFFYIWGRCSVLSAPGLTIVQ